MSATSWAIAILFPQAVAAQRADPAPAVPAAEGPMATEQEIRVIAQRRTQKIVDVPATVDVITAKELVATSSDRFEDVARINTSLQLSAYQGETQSFVRGIGSVTFIGGFDSSVAMFSGGVYLSRPSAVAPALFDLDRIEVLEGPQGSLYGRNATGGAILLVNHGASATWQGETRITAGNYGTANVFGALGGPLSDAVSFRLAVGTNNHSGYSTLDFGPSAPRRTAHAEDRHDVTGRLTLDWRPSDTFDWQLVGDYYRADDRAVVFQFAGPGYANNPLFLARMGQGIIGAYSSRILETSFRPYNRASNWGLSNKITIDALGGKITAQTAFRRTRPRNLDDLSNSTVLAESQFKQERSSQVTQDVTYSSPDGATVPIVIGASYFHEHNAIRNEFFFPYLLGYLGGTGTADCCLLKASGSTRTDAIALFAETTVPLLPRFLAVVGGRWSRERRGGTNLEEFVGYATLNDAPFNPATFSAFTPKLSFQYRPSPAVNFYATVSNGFKSGGYNIGTSDNDAYRPEKVWSFELGAKWDAPSLGLHASLAAFHYDYRDLQVQDVVANSVIIRNAATAKIDGVEAAASYRVGRGLTLEAAGTYLDARFARYRTVNLKTPALGVLDLAGNPLPQAPRLKFRTTGQYEVAVSPDRTIGLRIDAMWQDRIYFSAFRDPKATQKPYAWLKARLSLGPPSGAWEIAAFVDNLANIRAFTNISITGDLDGSRATGNLAPPRTFGAQISRRF